MKKRRVFLFPTEEEAAPFRRLAPDAEVRISGVGAAETAAATALALRDGCRDLVLAGIAGSYDSSLELGAVVAVADERVAGLPAAYARSYTAQYLPKGTAAVRANTVASCGAAPDGAQIENMEGAVFFAMCAAAGVRFCQIRSVSNIVGAPRDEWQTDTATQNLAKVLNDTFIKKSFMTKNKIILWVALAVIAIAIIALVVAKWKVWFAQIMTWVLVIAVAFLAGWLIGRFGGRKKSKQSPETTK